ncbi:MAG: Dabb family protein [Spirosomataceae bacterium]
MKTLFLIFAILLVASSFSVNAQTKSTKLFKHIVTVTFTENAPQHEIDEVDKSFKGLAKLKVVKAYEWGIAPITDRNKENKHTYAFTFASLDDLAKYAESPEHQKHIKVGVTITKKVEAVQYFVQ